MTGSHKTLHELQFWNHLDFSFKGKTPNAKAPVAQVTSNVGVAEALCLG